MKPVYYRLLLASAVLGLVLAGCGTDPSAHVSDFGVYTSLHLIAVDVNQNLQDLASTRNSGAASQTSVAETLTGANMHRYFESTDAQYTISRNRMDEMLDGVQRRSAFVQALQTSLELNLMANLVGAATQPVQNQIATAQLAAATTQMAEALQKSMEATTQPIIVSPFDQLDRTTDFYFSYLLKELHFTGDSRAVSPQVLAKYILGAMSTVEPESPVVKALTSDVTAIVSSTQKSPAVPYELASTNSNAAAGSTLKIPAVPTTQANSPQDRLLLVLFQTHILPGDKADMMTGVRLHIIGASDGYGKDDIKVIALHPARSYDIDEATFDQSEQTALGVAAQLSGQAGKVGVNANGSYGGSEKDQELEAYSSRISKEASFGDAGTHTYGFDFYPSNIEVHEKFFLWAFLSGHRYRLEGYLEPGAHDCAFVLMVPRNLRSFICGVTYLNGGVPNNTGTFNCPTGRSYYYFTSSGRLKGLTDSVVVPN